MVKWYDRTKVGHSRGETKTTTTTRTTRLDGTINAKMRESYYKKNNKLHAKYVVQSQCKAYVVKHESHATPKETFFLEEDGDILSHGKGRSSTFEQQLKARRQSTNAELLRLEVEQQMREAQPSFLSGPIPLSAATVQKKATHRPKSLSDSGSSMSGDTSESKQGDGYIGGINQLPIFKWPRRNSDDTCAGIPIMIQAHKSHNLLTYTCSHCVYTATEHRSRLTPKCMRGRTDLKHLSQTVVAPNRSACFAFELFESLAGAPKMGQARRYPIFAGMGLNCNGMDDWTNTTEFDALNKDAYSSQPLLVLNLQLPTRTGLEDNC